MRVTVVGTLAVLVLALSGSLTTSANAIQEPAQWASSGPAEARSLLDKYCVTCHNQRLRTAELALDAIDTGALDADAAVWERVILKLRMGAMPPPGRPRPPQRDSDAFVHWLESEIDAQATARVDPGRTESVHRLNRSEYQNAVRDLLALDVDVSSLLPADDTDKHGFDNMASVLSVSPVLMERYMAAARHISHVAVGLNPAGPFIATYKVPLLMYQDDRLSEDLPFGSRGGLAVRHLFPVDGEYQIRVRLQRNYVEYVRGLDTPHQLEVRVDGVPAARFTVGGESKGTPAPASYAGNLFGSPEWEEYALTADKNLSVRLRVKAGPRIVSAFFVKTQWEPEGVFQPRETGFPLAINERGQENAAVDTLTIDGPHSSSGPGDTPSRRKIFLCRPTRPSDEQRCATRILTSLARHAYRRPLLDEDMQVLLTFYRTGRAKGTFDDGVAMAIQRLLADPDFVFRIEDAPAKVLAGDSYAISDLQLASRLSFFLWSSIPDDELLDAATQGKLRNPAVLEQQVRRMLADARSKALIDNFAGQWLAVRNVRGAAPDPALFAEFDENLRDAFRRETELFLESQLREDRSVLDLLTADYTFVNERLARHYQIPNVYGNRFRRVALDPRQRGGLLGHGSILTVTSYANRTSPVVRGKWILENLLGAPPPPPPPDVPALPDRGAGGQVASVRERLERHRQNPACAVCHSQMDPLGFALEHFDAIGRWRAVDEERTPIDASGVLPDGSPFEALSGLQAVLMERRQDFARTLTGKLLSYAIGRGLEHYDQPAIRRVTRDAASRQYSWSSIILGIVQSAPFQMRRAQS